MRRSLSYIALISLLYSQHYSPLRETRQTRPHRLTVLLMPIASSLQGLTTKWSERLRMYPEPLCPASSHTELWSPLLLPQARPSPGFRRQTVRQNFHRQSSAAPLNRIPSSSTVRDGAGPNHWTSPPTFVITPAPTTCPVHRDSTEFAIALSFSFVLCYS